MAGYDPTMNSVNPANQGRNAAFAPIQSQSVTQPFSPPSSPGAGNGGAMGSVAPGTSTQALQIQQGQPPSQMPQPPMSMFQPGQVPPQLATMLMGANPNQPTQNVLPGGTQNQGMMGNGAFGAPSGFGTGQAMANNGPGMGQQAGAGAFRGMGGGGQPWSTAGR